MTVSMTTSPRCRLTDWLTYWLTSVSVGLCWTVTAEGHEERSCSNWPDIGVSHAHASLRSVTYPFETKIKNCSLEPIQLDKIHTVKSLELRQCQGHACDHHTIPPDLQISPGGSTCRDTSHVWIKMLTFTVAVSANSWPFLLQDADTAYFTKPKTSWKSHPQQGTHS